MYGTLTHSLDEDIRHESISPTHIHGSTTCFSFPYELLRRNIQWEFLFNNALENDAYVMILVYWEGSQIIIVNYPQIASTAKLFFTPIHGSPNVATDTPMLQLRAPTQAYTKILMVRDVNWKIL